MGTSKWHTRWKRDGGQALNLSTGLQVERKPSGPSRNHRPGDCPSPRYRLDSRELVRGPQCRKSGCSDGCRLRLGKNQHRTTSRVFRIESRYHLSLPLPHSHRLLRECPNLSIPTDDNETEKAVPKKHL